MIKYFFVASFLVILYLPLAYPRSPPVTTTAGTPDGSEQWGYVEVRPKAHMFWWYYKNPNTTQHPNNPRPIILWIPGGPGLPGALVNFGGVGPLTFNLEPNNLTWLEKADLLFVDNPVGSGFSYVEDQELLAKGDEEVANDLIVLLTEIFNKYKTLQKQPLYIVGGSYGARFSVILGLLALKAVENNKLKLILGGIVLGCGFISPEDFVASWGPLLKDVSRIDENGLIESNRVVKKIKQQIADGKWEDAQESWLGLRQVIQAYSNSVDLNNFLLDDPGTNYTGIENFMNRVIRKRLKIIPDSISWRLLPPVIFNSLGGDFMQPRINEVDELLKKGVNVTIYTGQLDVICATIGTEAWVKKLKWEGLETYLRMNRTPIYCGEETVAKGFRKSYKNLNFFWILGAGHSPHQDQPCVSVNIIGNITRGFVS